MRFSKFFLVVFLVITPIVATHAQKTITISGIIVDSATLVALPHAHIHLKKSGTGMVGETSGSFKLTAPVFDTLVFSCVGYKSLEYPVLFGDEDVLIRLTESYVMLPEVTTVGARLNQTKYEERRPVVSPTPTLISGIFSPFTYLSKTEREKRKLVKLREENVKIRTFVEVVNDPDLKNDMMKEFDITETEYYSMLARFNKENKFVQYLSGEKQILDIITAFFRRELSKK